jgi:two-component system nitrate/nitrite sensor histidine kinase NarQ
MSYQQIKWLILAIPTLTLGLWEYIRHTVLAPYLSMELGNWLAPLIVFLITITFLLKLFDMLEDMQEELREQRSYKAELQEREKLARELHDGISQSLFLLSVKMDKLELTHPPVDNQDPYHPMRHTIRRVYDDVRQAIANLKLPVTPAELPWLQSILQLKEDFQEDTGVDIMMNWSLTESALSPKEKVELLACLREALMNVQKHAKANRVWITCALSRGAWDCIIEDDGIGYVGNPLESGSTFGLRIMQERSSAMGWEFGMQRAENRTRVKIRKKEL